MRTIPTLLIPLLCAASGWGQDSFTVAGRVVNEVTGEGVARALVRLTGHPTERGSSSYSREVFSDGTGAFRFDAVPKSSIFMWAQKPQFTVAQSSMGPLAASREDVLVKLKPLAVIQGTVTDDAGRPMQGVQVRLYEDLITGGRKSLSQLRSVSTDDRGRYRMWNLQPGSVYVRAVGRAGGTSYFLGEESPTFVAGESFASMFFGGVERREQASPIELKAGGEAQADFRLRMEPAFTISGVVRNLQPYQQAKIELRNGNEDVTANRTLLNTATGMFVVRDVVPGSYWLRVTQGDQPQQLTAETMVRVAGGDVRGLQLAAQSGVKITVRVNYEGVDLAQSLPERYRPMLNGNGKGRGRGREESCTLQLHNSKGDQKDFSGYTTGSAQPMEILNVSAGEYEVTARCFGGYITSLVAGGVDLKATGKLTVVAGAAAPEILLQAVPAKARLEVKREGAAAAQNLHVLLVPMFASAEGPVRYMSASQGVAPGDYTVYVLNADRFPYLDAGAREQLRNGVAVRVQDGEQAVVTVKEVAQ